MLVMAGMRAAPFLKVVNPGGPPVLRRRVRAHPRRVASTAGSSVGPGRAGIGREPLVLFPDQPGDLDALLHSLVENKRDVRNIAGGEAVGDLGLDEPRGALEPVHGQALFLLGAHDRDEHLGVLQVGGDLGARDGDALDARVLDLEQDRVGRRLADDLGHTG